MTTGIQTRADSLSAQVRFYEQRLARLNVKRPRELVFENGRLVPTLVDLQAGASEVVAENITEVGDADFIADEAGDLNVVDITSEEDRYKVILIAAAFGVTMQQAMAFEQAQRNGRQWNPSDVKQNVALRVIAERANRYAAYGDRRIGTTGMVNNSHVGVDTTTFDPYSSSTTADDLIQFMVEGLGDVRKETETVETPDRFAVSVDLETRLTSVRVPDSGKNVKSYLIDEVDWIADIISTPECNSERLEANGVHAPGTNMDRIILYPRDEVVFERHVTLTAQVPPEYTYTKGLKRFFPLYQAVSPTIVNYPGAMRYVDLPKKP